MHYTGMIYRPPVEADTPLLEVTYGCSWNKCSFCDMYKTKFGISPLEHIEEDLKELSNVYPSDLKRIFIVNGDAFTLPTDRLLKISEIIHKYFPEIECIAAYASIRNIMTKTPEDLKQLHKAGYDCFYIGLETAYNPALKQMNKGYTQEDEYRELEKLENAGIEYNAIIMFGVAGKGNYKINVEETVKLLNRFKPKMILSMSTRIQENTPLAEMRENGDFIESTEREQIEEELLYLEKLEMPDDCYYFGSHPYNLIGVSKFFKYKQDMIDYIIDKLKEIELVNPKLLDTVVSRGSL